MPAESPLRDGNAPGISLIETLRWEPGTGFLRLDRHLARLGASAEALGFRHDANAANTALLSAVKDASAAQRVRLTLAASGSVEATAQPFQFLSVGTVWTLQLAQAQLSSRTHCCATRPAVATSTSRRVQNMPRRTSTRCCWPMNAVKSAKAPSPIFSSIPTMTAHCSRLRLPVVCCQAYCAANCWTKAGRMKRF